MDSNVIEPGSKEWIERVAELSEIVEPGWYYLSFANDDEFLGGLYIQGKNLMDVVKKSHERKLNPGGQVLSCGPISEDLLDENVPIDMRNKLLSKKEAESI